VTEYLGYVCNAETKARQLRTQEVNRLWHTDSEDGQDDPLTWSDVLSESEDEVMRVPTGILANTLQDRWESNTLYQDYLGNEHEVVLSDATTESENEALRIPAIKELEESPEFTTVASRWAARWARPGSAAREYLQAEYNPDDIALREWEVGLNN